MTNSDLDFWIGKWTCIVDDTVVGENVIRKTMNDRVVEENFMTYTDGFVGASWSVFDSVNSVWKQTWVDNAGAYMNFTGAKSNDTIFFIEDNSVTLNGQKHYRRMIFYSIELNSFEWKWQSSIDRIKWKTNWHIFYKRQ
ncbi:MAG TPA: hypothetical protein PKM97_10590 [Bacteroidia bacterium]|nr:hypothetical protein [Bacteroidia bacterium]